ncbi:MAG: phosphoglycerate dehydrogenase [Christensenellales bacterium]|jgi:D-3-phosphoglycerate dehydrogenase
MKQIRTLNAISDIVKERLPQADYTISPDAADPQGILVRSAAMHDMPLPESLLAVARAGAGTNNIPIDKCTQQGIVVFNTPGANANAVKELVLAAMLLASRNVFAGIEWAKTLKGQGDKVPALVEKGKGQFVGPELKGKRLGVIGLGAIGAMVANDCRAIGMDVSGYDPFISVEAAWGLSRKIHHATDLGDMVSCCDYITVHIPLLPTTRGMLDADFFAKLKPGAVLLNFSRGELVDTEALLDAMARGQVAKYVTDFPNEALLDAPGVICIPHLGASTPESEENCAAMAAEELRAYLEEGIIHNSVNFPNCDMPRTSGWRVTIAHLNIANMIGPITSLVGKAHINIANMINKSKKDVAYIMLDLDDRPSAELLDAIRAIEGVLRVRLIEG